MEDEVFFHLGASVDQRAFLERSQKRFLGMSFHNKDKNDGAKANELAVCTINRHLQKWRVFCQKNCKLENLLSRKVIEEGVPGR